MCGNRICGFCYLPLDRAIVVSCELFEKCKQKLGTDTSLLQQNRMYGPWSIHIFSQWTAIMDSTRMNNMEENLIVIKDFQLLTGILDLFHPCR